MGKPRGYHRYLNIKLNLVNQTAIISAPKLSEQCGKELYINFLVTILELTKWTGVLLILTWFAFYVSTSKILSKITIYSLTLKYTENVAHPHCQVLCK